MVNQSDTSANGGVVEQVAKRGLGSAVEAARTWAFANPVVPLTLTGAAVVSHFLHRRGRRSRLGDAVDNTLSAAGPLLDSAPSKSRWRIPTPLASLRHRFITRATRGARARRGESAPARAES
ncbi:hypothetical protein A5636_08025 [Mycobacterium asiaticum]|uniref:Uncharacterized protein n=1 Tax=Mycobacterium asiaticum TaxID=1790 RepID=A0A1A3MZ11_MYCAS|nr:hypothetical protein A5636_08025 [Mycobacterium asiaticum]